MTIIRSTAPTASPLFSLPWSHPGDWVVDQRSLAMTADQPYRNSDEYMGFTMQNITQDGHDYHLHHDASDRTITVVEASTLMTVGIVRESECGEYFIAELYDDGMDDDGGVVLMQHRNACTMEDMALNLIAAAMDC